MATKTSGTIRVSDNIKQVKKELKRAQKKKIPEATVEALNNTAFKIKNALSVQTQKRLDRPTKFTYKSGFGVGKANLKHLDSAVFIRDIQAKYLQWVIDGGHNTNEGKGIVQPTPNQRLNTYGNIPGLKKTFWNNKVFRKIGSGTGVYNKKGELLAVIKQSVNYTKKLLPFFKIGEGVANNVLAKELRLAIKKEFRKR